MLKGKSFVFPLKNNNNFIRYIYSNYGPLRKSTEVQIINQTKALSEVKLNGTHYPNNRCSIKAAACSGMNRAVLD
jgi:hypothetical protein